MPTRIYIDTSAVAKLFIAERETSDLRQWLSDRPEPHLVSSALLPVELLRLLRLVSPVTVTPAEQFLAADVDIAEITPPVLGDAITVPPPRLRTLDAIHLATALDLGASVDILLTYDKVLIEAARATGLT
ncbi:MAG: type II toxin-antitoxin system VapC family toxin, partial [Pseudonocardiaceae bacterium]